MILQRFWDKVEKTDSCWNWSAYHTPTGYGTFKLNNKSILAHRYSYEELRGCIPPELEIDHLCRNRRCVNPDHLEAVTHTVNVRRGSNKGGLPKQTHCKIGHALSGENLLVSTNGVRRCKRCRKEYDRKRWISLRRMLGDE